MLTRRQAVTAGAVLATLPVMSKADPHAAFLAAIRKLESDLGSGGRIGIQLIDPVTGRTAAYRATERFPMCSTFKLLLAGMILHRVDRRLERLNRKIAVPADGLLPNSPITKRVAGTSVEIDLLCDAAVRYSDNSAANLLLDTLGGPAGLTWFLRSIGDNVTRLDRVETILNEATPGDPRDTTTPAAMLDDMRRLVMGPVLSPKSRTKLLEWLINNTTGAEKFKKVLPPGWMIGDKTGAGGHGSNNEVAMLWPYRRFPKQPMFVAAFITGGDAPDDALMRNPIHQRIGELIMELVGRGPGRAG